MNRNYKQAISYPYTMMYEEIYKAARNNPEGAAYEFQGKMCIRDRKIGESLS